MAEFSLEGTGITTRNDVEGNTSIPDKTGEGNSASLEFKKTEEAEVDKPNLEKKEGTTEVTTEVSAEKKEEQYEGMTKKEYYEFNLGKNPAEPEGKVETKKETKKIEYDFKFPEGIELDCEKMDKFKEFAQKDGLSNDNAQAYITLVSNMITDEQVNQKKMLDDRLAQWASEVKSDPEIGGTKMQESLGIANRAIDQFGGKEFRKFLDLTGAGSNKNMLKFLYKIGKSIEEDSFIFGDKQPIPERKEKKVEYNEFGQPKLEFKKVEYN